MARGQLSSLEHALERDRRSLDQLSARLASTERRAALLEGEDHELGERLAETEQARHQLQTVVAETEAAHGRATRRLEAAEEALRQAEQELHRSTARADALERALDEARGAAGAELLSGVDGVVGTLLDVVEVDPGWEDAFEAAAGASVAAVVVSGREPAKAALSRLRQGGATGAVLALTGSTGDGASGGASGAGAPAGPRSPPGPSRSAATSAPISAAATSPGSRPSSTPCWPGRAAPGAGGPRPSTWPWPARIWWWSPGTGTGSRPPGGGCGPAAAWSPRRWSTRPGPGPSLAAVAAAEAADERTAARAAVESTRTAAAEAVRADDRNEVAHQTARTAHQRVAGDLAALVVELEEVRRDHAELDDRIARDTASGPPSCTRSCPVWRRPGPRRRRGWPAAREERQPHRRADRRGRPAPQRVGGAQSAGLVERRRVLTERLHEVDRRLTGHADERREAAERRKRLEADATAVERLSAVVATAQARLDAALAELRERYRLQLEAVRAGGARLEELRRQRSASEHELAAARSRIQTIELDLVEATIRRESVIEALRHELACGPDEALAAPVPELAEGSDPATRIAELEAELATLGPVNPLALEELSELGERHQFLEAQVEDVRSARRELHHVIRTLDEEIMHVFDSAFADVNEHFSTLVTSLFPGGTGRLSLTDPENLLDTGVEVEVRPAGRNVRRLSLLSGGERSLVALAFLFAVFRSRPSPFYLMDEVEAALDDVNLQRFLGLVHEFRGRGPADHREPPEADHGGGRRPVRGDHGSWWILQGGQPEGVPGRVARLRGRLGAG